MLNPGNVEEAWWAWLIQPAPRARVYGRAADITRTYEFSIDDSGLRDALKADAQAAGEWDEELFLANNVEKKKYQDIARSTFGSDDELSKRPEVITISHSEFSEQQ